MKRRPAILRPPEAINLAGTDTGRDTISATKISRFLGCHRKYDFHHRQRLELISRPRSFTLGTAYQKAIEWQDPEVGVRFLNGFKPCESCKARGYIEQESADSDGRILRLGTEPCEDCDGNGWTGEQQHFWTDEDEAKHRENEAVVRGASALYLRTFTTPVGERREFEFRVPLRNPRTGAYSLTFDLLGYADGVVDPWFGADMVNVTVPDDATFEVEENKLVDRLMPVSVKRLPLDRQLALIRYGVWRATGRPIGKVHYRFMLKPSIKQRGGRKKDKSDAESHEQFCERIENDYIERPEFYCRPQEPIMPDTDADMLRVEAELWEWAAQLRDLERRGLYDRNTSHCTDFGGCPYLPICTGDPDAMSLYRIRAHHAPDPVPTTTESQ